ncbi:MAG: type II toxin-antitoxin system VapC family toxin [Pseudolabrys sp.]
MTLVVDASVAAQWVLEQDASARAAALRNEDRLIAPSLVAAEIASAVWKAVRRGDVTPADALVAIDVALLPFDALIPTEELRGRALALAIELDHPVYDCFYLALAEREACALISADARLIAAAKQMKGIAVRAL